MMARPAQDQLARREVDVHLSTRRNVVDATCSCGQHLAVKRPRDACKSVHDGLAVGVQPDDHLGFARHDVKPSGGNPSEIASVCVNHSVALCLDEGCGDGQPVVEPASIDADNMHGHIGMVFSAPPQHLDQIRGVLIGQGDALHAMRGVAHAVQITEDVGEFNTEVLSVRPATVATEHHRWRIEEPRWDAAIGQSSCSKHEDMPAHGLTWSGSQRGFVPHLSASQGMGFERPRSS